MAHQPDHIMTAVIAAFRRRHDQRTGDQPRKIRALVLARRFGIGRHSNDETRKRRVRELVDDLRRDGQPIVANRDGYWLATTPADHQVYQEFLRRMGLANLVTAASDKRSDAAAQASGQLLMFSRG